MKIQHLFFVILNIAFMRSASSAHPSDSQGHRRAKYIEKRDYKIQIHLDTNENTTSIVCDIEHKFSAPRLALLNEQRIISTPLWHPGSLQRKIHWKERLLNTNTQRYKLKCVLLWYKCSICQIGFLNLMSSSSKAQPCPTLGLRQNQKSLEKTKYKIQFTDGNTIQKILDRHAKYYLNHIDIPMHVILDKNSAHPDLMSTAPAGLSGSLHWKNSLENANDN